MTEPWTLLAALVAGALLAMAYFVSLWRSVRSLEGASPGVGWAVVTVIRLGLAALALFAIARYAGWQPLVAATVGFAIARTVVLRHVLATARGGREPTA